MPAWNARSLVLLTVLSLSWSVSGADKLSDLQARFDHETSAVHKAKLFEKLGDEQFAEARRASLARDYVAVGQIMESYRDNARATLAALKKEHPDAERQLGGYKQLQIHIHRGVREVDEEILVVALEYRPPLELVRNDLSSMDDELLLMLFPQRPGGKNSVSPALPPPKPSPVVAAPPSIAAPPATPPQGAQKAEAKPEASSDGRAAEPSANQPAAKPIDTPEQKPVEGSLEKPNMNINIQSCLFAAAMTCGVAFYCDQLKGQDKDYLSAVESDKIRDAETTNERIKLFLSFADDRLKKFQYELQHPSTNKHPEMLNALMNGYVGCVDDAADLMQLGIEKQENIRPAVDLMASKTKEFLDVLNKISNDAVEIAIYKDNLDDAIEGTRDAMNDAEKAKKNVAPPPVRRKN
jgi:hypothetical protein